MSQLKYVHGYGKIRISIKCEGNIFSKVTKIDLKYIK